LLAAYLPATQSQRRWNNRDAASYGRSVQLLRSAGLDTPLELVTAHYVEAVKVLGTDKIVAAAPRVSSGAIRRETTAHREPGRRRIVGIENQAQSQLAIC